MADVIPGYRILDQIGRGARSKISKCLELKTGRTFAVKQVLRRSPEDDPFIAQVENEYAVSHAVSHPYLRHSFHLRRVRRFFRVSELYLIMDYVNGLTLEVARPNRLATFLTIFRKVAEGLTALHDSGYIHSDIKPINIMLAPKGVVKVIDFGQSCRIGHRKERIQGTPDFIAPEQVRRLPLDERTDVFNLGTTMYWMLTSRNYPTVIRAQDVSNRMNLVEPTTPVAPIDINDKIPLSLSTLVMECCRENPRERPATMRQLDARLAAVQELWRKQRETLRARLRTTQALEHQEEADASGTEA
jgi:serine/threonine protein kinase